MGTVQFWNGQTGTLEQSIPHNTVHADVLCLQVSPNKCQLFVSGIDSRVACIERQQQQQQQLPASSLSFSGTIASSPIGTKRDWKVTQAQRPHTHDVKAMVLCQLNPTHNMNNNNNNASTSSSSSSLYLNQILLTGGLDTKICTYFPQQFSQHRPKVIHPWPTLLTTPIRGIGSRRTRTSSSSKDMGDDDGGDRILLMQREGQVDLYRVQGKQQRASISHKNDDDQSTTTTATVLMGSIEMASSTTNTTTTSTKNGTASSNLVSSCISPNGQWVALCDATTMALFELVVVVNEGDQPPSLQQLLQLQPRQVELPSEVRSKSMVSLSFLKEDTKNGTSTLVAVNILGQMHILTIQDLDNNTIKGDDDEDDEEQDHDHVVQPRIAHAFLKQPVVPTTTSLSISSSSSSSWPQVPIHFIASKTEVLASSTTTSWMATLRHGSHNAIDIYQKTNTIRPTVGGRVGDETDSSYTHFWTVPSLGSGAAARPTCICFLDAAAAPGPNGLQPSTSLCLAVATASSAVYVFDVRQQRFHAWSEQRCVGVVGSEDSGGGRQRRLVFPAPPLPIDPVVNHFNFCREYPVRLIANPKDPTKLIVVRSLFFFVLVLGS
jgi:hypothetical protein